MMTWKQLQALSAAGALSLAMVVTCAAQRAEPSSEAAPAGNTASASQDTESSPAEASAETPAASATDAEADEDDDSDSAAAPADAAKPAQDAEAKPSLDTDSKPAQQTNSKPSPVAEPQAPEAKSADVTPAPSAIERRQIHLGPILDQMELTEAQQSQIQFALRSARQQVMFAKNDITLNYDQKSEKIWRIRADMRKQVAAILTPEQRRQWRQLMQQQRRGQMMWQHQPADTDSSQPATAEAAKPAQ